MFNKQFKQKKKKPFTCDKERLTLNLYISKYNKNQKIRVNKQLITATYSYYENQEFLYNILINFFYEKGFFPVFFRKTIFI